MCPVVETISSESFSSFEEYEKYRGLVYQLWAEKETYRKMLFGPKKERFIPSPPQQMHFNGIDAEEIEAASSEVAAENILDSLSNSKFNPSHLVTPGFIQSGISL